MNTPSKLLAAILFAAGLLSSPGETILINLYPGDNVIANPFDRGGNTLAEVIPSPPVNSDFYKYSGGGFSVWTFDDIDLLWLPDGATKFNPGVGAILNSPIAFTLTLSGSNHVPVLPLALQPGLNLVGCQTNAICTYDQIVGTLPANNTILYKYNPGPGHHAANLASPDYTLFTFTNGGWLTFTNGGWSNSIPMVAAGEAVFIYRPPGSSYTIAIHAGLNLIANQLDHGSNTLNEIMPNVPAGSVLYKYSNGSNTLATSRRIIDIGWDPPEITLNPGEGAFLQSPSNFNLTITGTPHVPVLPLTLQQGHCYLLSRQTPDPGTYETIVGASPGEGATVYQFNAATGGFMVADFIDGAWEGDMGGEPVASVGEAMWICPAGGSPPSLPSPPAITQQPQSLTVTQGQTATFTVAATGSPPLSYHWRFNEANLSSGINSTYTINTVQTNDLGVYDVVISNASGSVTSAPVSLSLTLTSTCNPGKVIWVDNFVGIDSADVNGANQQLILPVFGLSNGGVDVAINPQTGKIYWGDNSTVPGQVWEANKDGSSPHLVTTTTPGEGVHHIAVDPVAGMVYWDDVVNLTIHRAYIATGAKLPVPNIANTLRGIALDLRPASPNLYYYDGYYVYRADLDGNNAVQLPNPIGDGLAAGFALDTCNDKIYVASTTFPHPGVPVPYIRSANLSDGSGLVTVLSGGADVGNPEYAIALDLKTRTMYWTSRNNMSEGQIKSANMDTGSGVTIPVTASAGSGRIYRGITLCLPDYSCPPTNHPPSLSCSPTLSTCVGANAQVSAQVSDLDGDSLSVVWQINSTTVNTQTTPAGISTVQNVPLNYVFTSPGTYTVTITVSDGISSPVTCTTIVTVVANPPVVYCPADRIVDCTDDTGAFVSYSIPTATSSCCPPVTVTCSPPSGWFSIGTAPVICTAVDSCGQSNQCCFSLVVRGHGYGKWEWARMAGGPKDDYGNAVAVDAKGNMFVTGSFVDAMGIPAGGPFSIQLFNGFGSNDIFVAKYNAHGAFLWAVRAGGAGQDAGYGVAVDADGNAYVTGEFTGSASFESYPTTPVQTLHSSAGSRDIFVAKYDPNGHCLWAVDKGGSGTDTGLGIAVASNNGDVLVTGAWEVSGTREAFVLKLDSGGAQRGLAFSTGGSGHAAIGRAIAVDTYNDVYVAGDYGPAGIAFTASSTSLGAPSFSSGSARIFVTKFPFPGAGNPLYASWLRHSSHPGASCSHGATGIAVDPTSASVYLTGIFNGTTDFGNNVMLTSSKSGSCPNQLYDYFIAKLNTPDGSLGSPIWAIKGGGSATSDDETRGIAVEDTGNLYVTGFLKPGAGSPFVNEGPTMLVASYSPAGALRWTRNATDGSAGNSTPKDVGLGIAVDRARCVHVTGAFTEDLQFPPVATLHSSPSTARDMFVARICPICGCDQGLNLVVNGGFESPPGGGPLHANGSVPGWNGYAGVCEGPNAAPIEIWGTGESIASREGLQHLEISSSVANETVCQTVNGLTPGCRSTLCFWYTGRPGIDAITGSPYDNHFTLTLGGAYTFSTTLNPAPYPAPAPAVGGWYNYCTDFIPTASTLTIAFSRTPINAYDVGGAHIDDVSLIQDCCASICGMKFNDANHNGIKDTIEAGLPGWTILGRDSSGNVVGSALTDANGSYCIEVPQAPNGGSLTYTVEEVQQPNWSQTYPSTPVHAVTVTGSSTYGGWDFGNSCAPIPNLVINGGFETPSGGGSLLANGSVPGWNGHAGDCEGPNPAPIEIWTGGSILAREGFQHLEISSSVADETVCQTVNGLTPGCPATFCFWYTGRPGIDVNTGSTYDNRFTLTLSGAYASSTSLNPTPYPGPAPAVGGWYNYCLNFIPTAPTLTIAFSRTPINANDVGGAHIDDVSLIQDCCGFHDTDGDGMPDTWELSHGLNPSDPSDAAGDSDGDGMTNLQEYLAGTNPVDPATVLRLDPIVFTPGNGLRLRFTAMPDRAYILESTPSLGSSWTTHNTTPAEPAIRTVEVNVPLSGQTKFFRVRVN